MSTGIFNFIKLIKKNVFGIKTAKILQFCKTFSQMGEKQIHFRPFLEMKTIKL